MSYSGLKTSYMMQHKSLFNTTELHSYLSVCQGSQIATELKKSSQQNGPLKFNLTVFW